MTEPYLGEIRLVAFTFPPQGWAFCNGQKLPISHFQALFSIIGTTYGGDGRESFCLPNLQGRVPVHVGNGIGSGETDGEYIHTLTTAEMPAHNHPLYASGNDATDAKPQDNLMLAGAVKVGLPYGPLTAPPTMLNPKAVSPAGASRPHCNIQPSLVLNYIIALEGAYPPRS